MARLTLGAMEFGDERDSGFAEFINVVMGRSIISGADWGNERIEFGLSGDGMLRVFWTPEGLHTNFISTTKACQVPLPRINSRSAPANPQHITQISYVFRGVMAS